MYLFLVLYFLFFFLALICYSEKCQETSIYFFSIGILLLYTALRFEVGADWDYYESIFNQSEWSYVWGNLKVEPLYVLLCMIVKAIGGELYVVTALVAIVTIALVGRSIYDYSERPMTVLFFFMLPFFLLGLSQIRQGLALAIVVYAYRYIENKKLFPFLLLIFFAAGFHFSALFFLPMYYVARLKLSNWVVVAIIALFVLFDSLFRTDLLLRLSGAFFEHIHYKYMAYYDSESLIVLKTRSFYWRIIVLFLASYLVYANPERKRSKYFRNIYFTGLIYYIIFAATPVISGRGSMYFKVFEVFILTDVIQYLWKEKKQLLFAVIVSFSVLYYSRQLYYQVKNERMKTLIEYKTIFQKNTQTIEENNSNSCQ